MGTIHLNGHTPVYPHWKKLFCFIPFIPVEIKHLPFLKQFLNNPNAVFLVLQNDIPLVSDLIV